MRQRADFGDAGREWGGAGPFARSIRWHRGTVPRTSDIDKEDLTVQYYLNNHFPTPLRETPMPTSLDIAFAIVFPILIVAVEVLYFNKRLKARIAAGVPNARRSAYRYVVIGEWGITAAALLLWARAHRPWDTLGLVPPQDWRLVPGILITALIVAVTIRQFRAVRRLGVERRTALRGRLGAVEFFMPHTPAEHRWWLPLSLTAGFCEELLYRGFLTWLVASYVGLPAAIGVVVVAFGLGHASQGRSGVIKTGLVGLVMSIIVVLTGWLVPAMIVHALLDIGAGQLGFAIYYDRPAPA
jgi:CAAX protease family protein